MSSCECSYLKKTICDSALYGTYKVATTKVVNKAPKSDKGVLEEKVSKGKLRNEILMDVGVYGLSSYTWNMWKDKMMGYEPEIMKDVPIDVMKSVYQAGIISLVDMLRGQGSMNRFIHELLLVSATDMTFNLIDGMEKPNESRKRSGVY